MITREGVDWLTAVEAGQVLGPDVSGELLRDWKRRGLIRGAVIRGVAHYRRDDLEEAEAATRARTRPRRAGLTTESG
jgi:hypothetical protein